MDYSIYKDDNVISTVERICKILNDVGINLEERFIEFPTNENQISGYPIYPVNCKFIPYSSRVTLFGLETIGTNGKGTSKENCRASAYSEFMERLQNQCLPAEILLLCSDKFCLAPDEKEYGKDTERILSKYKYLEIFSVRQPKTINNIPYNKCTPFYNIKDNKLYYLPSLHFVFSSNGMASGNTPEEALVQGFSEICERYAHNQIVTKNILMPYIPKKYYEKYDTIRGLIDYTEQLGWKVHIKDASLGRGLPVVCTVFENPQENIFSYIFGSQPNLPVAIERTFTEFFQGGVADKHDIEHLALAIENYSEAEMKKIFSVLTRRTWLFRSFGKMHNIFLNNNSNYEFSASSWIDNRKKYTNKELLKFLIDRITSITNNDIFVRDVSFLGFPSFHIFIPEFSETNIYSKEKINMDKWQDYTEEKDSEFPNDIDSLISALLHRLNFSFLDRTTALFIPDEYLLILCYIVKDDIDNILKYCKIMKNKKEMPDFISDFVPEFMSENRNLIDIIYHYFTLKQQEERSATIKNILYSMYDKEDVEKFLTLIKNLNFEYIKKIISDSKKNVKTEPVDMTIENKINEIKQKLIQKYIENTPNQMELAKIFDFSEI